MSAQDRVQQYITQLDKEVCSNKIPQIWAPHDNPPRVSRGQIQTEVLGIDYENAIYWYERCNNSCRNTLLSTTSRNRPLFLRSMLLSASALYTFSSSSSTSAVSSWPTWLVLSFLATTRCKPFSVLTRLTTPNGSLWVFAAHLLLQINYSLTNQYIVLGCVRPVHVSKYVLNARSRVLLTLL